MTHLFAVQGVKEARLRQEKAEEEVVELTNKSRQLEMELDVYTERLSKQVSIIPSRLSSRTRADSSRCSLMCTQRGSSSR